MANPYNNIGTQKSPVTPNTKAPQQGTNIPQVAYHNIPAARAKNTGLRNPKTSGNNGRS